MTEGDKIRKDHSIASDTGSPDADGPVTNQEHETSHLLKERTLYFFSEDFFRDSLGPFAPLWYLIDYLVPERFRTLRKVFGLLWKGFLIVALLYIAAATVNYNYFQLFHGTVNK